jgi:hypothetical protein
MSTLSQFATELLPYVSDPAVAHLLFERCDRSRLAHGYARRSKPFTTEHVLEYLRNRDLERAIAATRLVHDPAALRDLYETTRNPRILRAVIANPCTPLSVLLALKGAANRAIAERAANEVWCLAAGGAPEPEVVAALENPDAAPLTLVELIRGGSDERGLVWVRETVLRRARIAPEAQAALVERYGHEAYFRLRVRDDLSVAASYQAHRQGMDPWFLPRPDDDDITLLELLVESEGIHTRHGWYFNHPLLSAEAIRRCAESGYGRLIYGHPNCPTDLWERAILTGNPSERAAALTHPVTPAHYLKIATIHGDRQTAAAVAANPSTTTELFEKLAMSESTAVRAAIAANPNAPLGLRKQLAPHVPAKETWEPEVKAALPATAEGHFTASVLEHRLGHELEAWEVAIGLLPCWQQDLGALADAALALAAARGR